MSRWRGLVALVGDAVEHGATAVQRVHEATARRPYAVLEQVPGVAGPARAVQAAHEAAVALTYTSIRGVARLVRGALAGPEPPPDPPPRG